MNAPFKKRRLRIGALTIASGVLFALIALRLVLLVVFDGPRLDSLARIEHMSKVELAAPRGPIVGRNGEALALSAETRSVYARPAQLLATSTAAERDELAHALGMAPATLETALHRKSPFVWLRRHMPPAQARAAEALGLDGVGSVSEYKRFYPEGTLAASVVGLAGMDGQGLSGLELQYNHLIQGKPIDLRFYHDALGHPIFDSPLALRSPRAGARLVLTIDGRIEAVAEHDLAEEVRKSGAQRGAVVVLNPFSGAVLALANVVAGASPIKDRLHDTAVQDAFEPGSTMKGLLASIALQDRVITPRGEIYCQEGSYRVGGRTIHDDSPHGWLDLGQIIEVSSNIGAAKIALKLGSERFYRGLRAFGLGSRTGIDLPGESGGILHKPSTWDTIDLANHGFGQGIAVTPIQLATAYAAIANGGYLMRPYVVKAAYNAAGDPILIHTPEVRRRVISPDVAHAVNSLLQGVVNGPDGTGRLAKVGDFVVAGKTGTAQMVDPRTGAYYQHRLVASFVGFVPAGNPRLVILVVLYNVGHGHYGGLVAAPVFSRIASAALRDMNVAPPAPGYDVASLLPIVDTIRTDLPRRLPAPVVANESAKAAATVSADATPDFSGMSLRSAFALAHRDHLDLTVEGDGYVVGQRPAPGSRLPTTPIKLRLAPVLADASSGTNFERRSTNLDHASSGPERHFARSAFGDAHRRARRGSR